MENYSTKIAVFGTTGQDALVGQMKALVVPQQPAGRKANGKSSRYRPSKAANRSKNEYGHPIPRGTPRPAAPPGNRNRQK
jgi:hypothetical protein